jgi:hypothetical protein
MSAMLVAQNASVNGAAAELPASFAAAEPPLVDSNGQNQQSVGLKFGVPGFQVDHFLAIGWIFVWRFDRQSNEVMFEFEHRDDDVVTDDDCFVFATGNDLHR